MRLLRLQRVYLMSDKEWLEVMINEKVRHWFDGINVCMYCLDC